MFYRPLILFFIVCVITGVTTLGGSVIGHAVGQAALFAGAVIGAIVGILISCIIAAKIRTLQPVHFKSTFTGDVIGYAISAVIPVNFLHSAFITIGSIAFTGIGAIAGYFIIKNE